MDYGNTGFGPVDTQDGCVTIYIYYVKRSKP